MKTNKIVTLILTLGLLVFTGCQDPIFSTINKEVSLEKVTISGDINSIVRYTYGEVEYLYLQNGGICRKVASNSYYGAWSKVNAPSGVVIQMAADDSTLYALVATYYDNLSEYENTGSTKYIYASTDNAVSWTCIKSDIGSGTAVRLFCTNTIKPANRKAYVNIGGTVYNCSSTALTSNTDPNASGKLSCAYYNGSVHFYEGYAAVTNEIPGTGTDTDGTRCYYSKGSSVYYEGTGLTSGSHDYVNGTIYSLAYTADTLLIGSSYGIAHVTHDSTGALASSTSSFSTNAESTLSSQYEVNALLTLDPSLSETGGVHYGSLTFSGTGSNSAQFNHIGLWAYYPARGNWNCE